MKKLNLKYISEVIKDDHITKWKNGDVVLLEAQMGTGKTTFTVNDLLHLTFGFLQVLYICNRKKLSRDIKISLMKKYEKEIPKLDNDDIDYEKLDKIKKINNITVTTYQAIACNPIFDLNKYKYIINDECHFFLSDASWNNATDLTFKKLIRADFPNTIRIFVSATMDEIKHSIVKASSNKSYEYDTGRDYSYLDVKYFQKDDNIVQLIKNDKSDDKWVIFVKSVFQGDKLKKKLFESNIDLVFVHAKSKINPIVNERFKEKVLICTKVYDNGINIQDDKVKHIVVNANDRTTFLQEIGRVRIDINNPRMINLYIPKTYPKTWRSYINKVYNPKVEQYKLFKKSYELFKKKYSKRFKDIAEDIFYFDDVNNKWKINILGLWRLDQDLRYAQELVDDLENNDSFQFIMNQLGWLELEQTFDKLKLINDVTSCNEVEKLDEYLDSITDKKLFADEQRKLSDLIIKELITVGKNIDCRTKKLKSTTIESIIRGQLDLPYAVSKSLQERKGDMRGKRYVIISKLKSK